VNGDVVRDVRFPSGGGWRPARRSKAGAGYDVSQVDDLLRRIAVELDAGRSARPLIASATFRLGHGLGHVGYEMDAVDWFLGQLRCWEDASQPAGMDGDPWRGLPVGNHFTRSGHFAEECANAWRDFGQQPGAHLRWVRAGAVRHELRMAEQQTIASLRLRHLLWWRPGTVSTGGRTFTWRRVWGSEPGTIEIACRSHRESQLRFLAADTPGSRELAKATLKLREHVDYLGTLLELRDETGTPVLYASGNNYAFEAKAHITFPDQRWLRFPVRGTNKRNAIMTAVDQAGNKVARYRLLEPTVEITVHPGQPLTDELVLAIAISAPWVHQYFEQGGGG
jgi:hypothetical protein